MRLSRSPRLQPFATTRRALLVVAALATLATLASGCGRNAVRATEKELLADQIMSFDQDRHEAASDDHVLTNREGSAGGKGAKGGGCGCN
jgi:Domain of unknown function (DUF4266)